MQLSYSGNAIYTGSVGYKWDSGMRVELEVGYDDHDASKLRAFGFAGSIGHPFLTGGTSTTSALVNFVYDWDLGNAGHCPSVAASAWELSITMSI